MSVTILDSKSKKKWAEASLRASVAERAEEAVAKKLPSITLNQWMSALEKAQQTEAAERPESPIPAGFVSRQQLAEIFGCNSKSLIAKIALLKKHDLIETIMLKRRDLTGYMGRVVPMKFYKLKEVK
jgi:DNA-binding IscR family transcriptional regulator